MNVEHQAVLNRLHPSIHEAVKLICARLKTDNELESGSGQIITFTDDFQQYLAEILMRLLVEQWSNDLNMFARHAKRSILSLDDVRLLFRNNTQLLASLNLPPQVEVGGANVRNRRRAPITTANQRAPINTKTPPSTSTTHHTTVGPISKQSDNAQPEVITIEDTQLDEPETYQTLGEPSRLAASSDTKRQSTEPPKMEIMSPIVNRLNPPPPPVRVSTAVNDCDFDSPQKKQPKSNGSRSITASRSSHQSLADQNIRPITNQTSTPKSKSSVSDNQQNFEADLFDDLLNYEDFDEPLESTWTKSATVTQSVNTVTNCTKSVTAPTQLVNGLPNCTKSVADSSCSKTNPTPSIVSKISLVVDSVIADSNGVSQSENTNKAAFAVKKTAGSSATIGRATELDDVLSGSDFADTPVKSRVPPTANNKPRGGFAVRSSALSLGGKLASASCHTPTTNTLNNSAIGNRQSTHILQATSASGRRVTTAQSPFAGGSSKLTSPTASDSTNQQAPDFSSLTNQRSSKLQSQTRRKRTSNEALNNSTNETSLMRANPLNSSIWDDDDDDL